MMAIPVSALHKSKSKYPLHFSRISELETDCHGLRQQLEELRMYTSMLERREAERVEVRDTDTGGRGVMMMMMMMCHNRSRQRRGWPR